MTWLTLLISTLLASTTWLYFHTTEYIPLWKLTIVIVEFGHYFAILSALLFLLSIWQLKKNRRGIGAIAAFLSLYTAIIFSSPSLLLKSNFPNWQSQLENAFGKVSLEADAAPRFSKLFIQPKIIEPKILEFAQSGKDKLAMEFYPARSDKPAPWVIVVHGGGWNSGERSQLPELNSILAVHGIAVASIDYRLAPQYQWPAPREDVLNAAHYLKEHAKELGLDAKRWAILGRSAGGQIAESVAYEGSDPSLKGCIAFYAPSDMNFAYHFAREDDILRSRSLIRDYLGGDPTQARANFDATSPLNFVRAGVTPTLLFHGPRDSLVWVKHSERLIEKLKSVGVASAYIEIPWATHGFDFNIHGPSGQLSTYAIRYFLARVFSN